MHHQIHDKYAAMLLIIVTQVLVLHKECSVDGSGFGQYNVVNAYGSKVTSIQEAVGTLRNIFVAVDS